MRILREEDAEMAGRHGDPRSGRIVEEADVLIRAVVAHRLRAIRQRLPAHLLVAFQHQLDVYVLLVALQFRFGARASWHILHNDKQLLADDGIAPRCERQQVGVADVVERAREQRVQRGVAGGLGGGGEDHDYLLRSLSTSSSANLIPATADL